MFPKVQRSAAGDYVALYWDAAGSALKFKQWNGSAWVDYTSITIADLTGAPALDGRDVLFYANEHRVNFDFDSQNNLHVIFCAGYSVDSNTHDGIHGVYDGNSWSFAVVIDELNQPNQISMYIDNNDKIHIAYMVDSISDHLLKYSTNQSGSWLPSIEILNTDNRGEDELHDTHIVVDSSGLVTVIYRREDNQNDGFDNYYETSSSNYTSFSTPELVLDGQTDSTAYRLGSLALDSSDKLNIVYSDITNSTAHYANKDNGTWNTEQLLSSGATITSALDIQAINSTLYVLTTTPSGFLYQIKPNGGSWGDGGQFSIPGSYRDGFAIAANPPGYMHVSESSANWTAYYTYLSSETGGFPWIIFHRALTNNVPGRP